MKAVLLCRVSTEQQDYEAQIRDLKKYAIKKGANEVHIIATKESGFKKIDEREGWNEAKNRYERLSKRIERDLSVVNSGLFKKEKEIEEIKKGTTPVTEEELDNIDRANLHELIHKIVKKVRVENNRKRAFFSIELVGDFHHHLVVVLKGKEIKCFGARDVDTDNLEEIVFENMIGEKEVVFNEFKFNRI